MLDGEHELTAAAESNVPHAVRATSGHGVEGEHASEVVVGTSVNRLSLGDSLFAGYGVDPGQSYPARLEAALRARDAGLPLQLQLLQSEMLPFEKTEDLADSRRIRCGIEFDPIGRRLAYHFRRRHPGDSTDRGPVMGAPIPETVRVPASEVLHIYRPIDAGQIRGLPHVAPAMVRLFLLDQYDDAELDRKKVAAMHALFITTPAPAEPLDAAEGRDENDERTIDLQPGQITMLEPGEEIQTSAPADSGQTYEPFQYRTLLQVSAALGVPYAYLSNDMLKANYSNSRLALLEFRRRIEAYQHAVVVWQLCRQVWARWMDTAAFAGALDLPSYDARRREYLACGWLPPKWDWVDPLKDARAEIEQIDAGLKSRTQALAERGYDAEQVDTEIAADQAREKSLGLVFGSAQVAAAPAEAAAPSDQNG